MCICVLSPKPGKYNLVRKLRTKVEKNVNKSEADMNFVWLFRKLFSLLPLSLGERKAAFRESMDFTKGVYQLPSLSKTKI